MIHRDLFFTLLTFSIVIICGLVIGYHLAPAQVVEVTKVEGESYIELISERIMERNHNGISRPMAVYKAWLIEKYAFEKGLHPLLIAAVAQVESDFTHHTTRNHKGAIGIMQLTHIVEAKFGIEGINLEDNIKYGVKFLSYQLERYHGNLEKALNHYVGGCDKYVEEVIDIWTGLLSKQ